MNTFRLKQRLRTVSVKEELRGVDSVFDKLSAGFVATIIPGALLWAQGQSHPFVSSSPIPFHMKFGTSIFKDKLTFLGIFFFSSNCWYSQAADFSHTQSGTHEAKRKSTELAVVSVLGSQGS